jgi:bacterioferritin-associated ferredoxin
MIVCICRRVSDRTIRSSIDAGASSVEEVGRSCRAGTGCGACHETIREMLAERSENIASHLRLKVLSPYLDVEGEAA